MIQQQRRHGPGTESRNNAHEHGHGMMCHGLPKQVRMFLQRKNRFRHGATVLANGWFHGKISIIAILLIFVLHHHEKLLSPIIGQYYSHGYSRR